MWKFRTNTLSLCVRNDFIYLFIFNLSSTQHIGNNCTPSRNLVVNVSTLYASQNITVEMLFQISYPPSALFGIPPRESLLIPQHFIS